MLKMFLLLFLVLFTASVFAVEPASEPPRNFERCVADSFANADSSWYPNINGKRVFANGFYVARGVSSGTISFILIGDDDTTSNKIYTVYVDSSDAGGSFNLPFRKMIKGTIPIDSTGWHYWRKAN